MRTFLVPAALVVAALFPVPITSPAHAAATCLGQAATIEASSGAVTGTPGADVIVVSGTVSSVTAGDGDDTICVVGNTVPVTIDAGAGHDRVDATAETEPVSAQLGAGPGVDSFTGGPAFDYVFVGPNDLGPDTIRTGAGADIVDAFGGPVDVDLGPGADILRFQRPRDHRMSKLNLGTGHDRLEVDSGAKNVTVDLAQKVIMVRGRAATLRHAEDVRAAGDHVVLRGDRDRNELVAAGCTVTVSGSFGNDVTTQVAQDDSRPVTCPIRRARLFGGPGNDVMRGHSGNDLLLGGPGRDTAYGAGGTDRCVAEHRAKCER